METKHEEQTSLNSMDSDSKPRASSRQIVTLSYGGLLFLGAAFICFCGLVMHLLTQAIKHEGFKSYLGGANLKAIDVSKEMLAVAMYDHYLSIFLVPIVLLIAAVLCSLIGYSLLKAAGTAYKEVIPHQDYELLSSLLKAKPDKGIDQYVRLSSLTGLTGVFTKIGLTGLPLATISLTLIFSALSIFSDQFFDLAKLTLGAFIGSYVQKRAEITEEKIIAASK